MMQKRDKVVLIIAIICGLLAFILVFRFLKRSAAMHGSAPVTSTSKNSMGTLPIPSGMRALTLTANEIDNLPAMLETGSYVDILGVLPNYEGKMELQTIVRSTQVINLKKRENSGIESLTVTLSSVGAEVVTKAMAQGKLHLVLRPDSGEKGVLQMSGMGFTEVIRGVEKEKKIQVER